MAYFKTLSPGMALQEMQGFSHAILIMDTFSFPPQLQLRILVYLVFLQIIFQAILLIPMFFNVRSCEIP